MAHDQVVTEIELQRGNEGLGFNIRGGNDQPYVVGDNGIFVSRVRETGAAFNSGLLAAGDKILEVNGIDISSVDHQKAVEIFLSTGDNSVVRMKVIKNAYKDIQLKKDQEQEQSASTKRKWILFAGFLAVGVGAFFVHKRFNRR
ncbi:unnamed protein product [Oikopleura dioica]|uniref:PDZ domain-containing protein n=1 Tax=Oikopleura dioica TaxID=34765 RepID=E4WYH9_OIKDI|nr:unnamed protein product [Oikopleura dioica]